MEISCFAECNLISSCSENDYNYYEGHDWPKNGALFWTDNKKVHELQILWIALASAKCIHSYVWPISSCLMCLEDVQTITKYFSDSFCMTQTDRQAETDRTDQLTT